MLVQDPFSITVGFQDYTLFKNIIINNEHIWRPVTANVQEWMQQSDLHCLCLECKTEPVLQKWTWLQNRKHLTGTTPVNHAMKHS